jgi:Cysteine-rich secretory protein family
MPARSELWGVALLFAAACSGPPVAPLRDDAGVSSTNRSSSSSSSGSASGSAADAATGVEGDASDASSSSGSGEKDAGALADAGGPSDAAASGDGCTANLKCMPTAPSTGDFNADCVARVNQFRACVCLPPLARWDAGESCANQDSQFDYTQNTAHAGFQGKVCTPQGNAENECPSWPSTTQIVSGCMQQMFDEGPGTPYSAHGHFINMTNTSYKTVACGFYKSPDAGLWSVQNFQ